MNKTKKIIGTLALAAGLLYGSNNAIAEDKKPALPISASVSAGVMSKDVLISGKPLSEFPMANISGNLNIGPVTVFGGAYKDKEAVKEIDLGISGQATIAQNDLGKLTAKLAFEKKQFPYQTKKDMYLADLTIAANTKYGDLNMLLRKRFESQNYTAGRTAVLSAATPSLNLGEIAGMKASIKGTGAIAYQDQFVGTTKEFGYFNYGLSLGLKGKNMAMECWLKQQETLRQELKDYVCLGVKFTYSLK